MIENYVSVPDLNLVSPKNNAKIIFPLIYFNFYRWFSA